MSAMTLAVNLGENKAGMHRYLELTGTHVEYWVGEGHPIFRGSLEYFAEQFPITAKQLLDQGYIKQI